MDNIFPLVYFGNIAWWQLAINSETIGLADKQIYERQTFRNRMSIMGPNTIQVLSIPIKKSNKKIAITEAGISYTEPWPQLHLRSLQAAYGKSPYYMYYMPYIEPIILGNYSTLAALNLASLQTINKLLKTKIDFSIGADKPSHFDSIFDKSTINKYNQVFENKHGFVPNLSILDLLFNLGPDTKRKLEIRN
jgi:hypothetical protein